MLRLLCVLGVFVALFGASQAQRGIEIIKPIRDTGDEIALIFTSVYPLTGDKYRQLAGAIQAASDLRIWVALNDRPYHAFAGRFRLPKAPEDSIKALKQAGMVSDNFVGVAHGEGGPYLEAAAKDSELKAVILLGSTIPRTDALQDYPLPILTLAAELDGIVRVTRMAVEFEKLQESVKASPDSMYRTPVILLEGVNHAQLASGVLPDATTHKDLVADTELDEAHSMISTQVNSFLTVAFGSTPSQVDTAKANLEASYSKSEEYFQRILDVRALDVGGNGNGSLWTIQLQEHVADEFADEITISNMAGGFSWFYDMSPSITTQNGGVVVTTRSTEMYSTDDRNPKTYLLNESPYELDVKLKTMGAIWEALATGDNATLSNGPSSTLRPEPATCQSLNELALEVALDHVSPAALQRYKARGRPIVFEEDTNSWTLFLWGMTNPGSDNYPTGLHVRAVAYTTPITNRSNPGTMCCKLISPYRALEWVTIDSLRDLPKYG